MQRSAGQPRTKHAPRACHAAPHCKHPLQQRLLPHTLTPWHASPAHPHPPTLHDGTPLQAGRQEGATAAERASRR